ncbi:AAA family ATPase [uncultured Deefgea sp.]|uniref:AAA family ATPase n=1 Tax=uncultured Deefgea sp. TaxID=1304914 RepID=UPI00262F7B81|nr:AAA family ATPase [uncultured Deefgea sp.]
MITAIERVFTPESVQRDGMPLYPLLTAADLAKQPPLSWLVHDIFPRTGLACVFGVSGCGKTFVVLDLIATIASGRDWFGHKTVKCPIVYVGLEGQHGIKQRVQAMQTVNEESLDGVHFMTEPFSLLEERDMEALIFSLQSAGVMNGLLVIDTLNRASPNSDENSSRDMGRILESVQRLQAAIGGLVLLVHHTGKDGSKGMRGHSSLHAALDSALEVKCESKGARSLKVAKSKDGRDGDVHSFSLKVVELGFDDDDDSVRTSCVVVPQTLVRPEKVTVPTSKAPLPIGANQEVAYRVIKAMLSDLSNGSGDSAVARIPWQAAISAVAEKLVVLPKVKLQRANEAITAMIKRGVLLRDAEFIALPEGYESHELHEK